MEENPQKLLKNAHKKSNITVMSDILTFLGLSFKSQTLRKT